MGANKFDAKYWVDLWADTLRSHPNIPTDESTMLGWFANAIMAGYDQRASEDASLRQREKRLREALKASHDVLLRYEMYCPECDEQLSPAKDNGGHLDDCELAALLKEGE